jgi:hypothetical protein
MARRPRRLKRRLHETAEEIWERIMERRRKRPPPGSMEERTQQQRLDREAQQRAEEMVRRVNARKERP